MWKNLNFLAVFILSGVRRRERARDSEKIECRWRVVGAARARDINEQATDDSSIELNRRRCPFRTTAETLHYLLLFARALLFLCAKLANVRIPWRLCFCLSARNHKNTATWVRINTYIYLKRDGARTQAQNELFSAANPYMRHIRFYSESIRCFYAK